MKKILFLTILLTLASSLLSGQDTLVKKERNRYREDEFRTLFGYNRPRGAYGSFTLGYSQIDLNEAIIFGGRLEWIMGHSMGFGFGGNGFINEYHYDNVLQSDVFLTGAYGGLYLEPILLPKFPVHLSFPVLLGAGGISYVSKESGSFHNIIEDSEAFLIAEPGVELELNLTRHFRFAAGVTYRFTTPFDIGISTTSPVSASSLENWSFLLTFKFGRF